MSNEIHIVILRPDAENEKFEALAVDPPADTPPTIPSVWARVRWPEGKSDPLRFVRVRAWYGPLDLGWNGSAMDIGAIVEAIHGPAVEAIERHLGRMKDGQITPMPTDHA